MSKETIRNSALVNLLESVRDNGDMQHIESFGFHDTEYCIVCRHAELNNFPEAKKAVQINE